MAPKSPAASKATKSPVKADVNKDDDAAAAAGSDNDEQAPEATVQADGPTKEDIADFLKDKSVKVRVLAPGKKGEKPKAVERDVTADDILSFKADESVLRVVTIDGQKHEYNAANA